MYESVDFKIDVGDNIQVYPGMCTRPNRPRQRHQVTRPRRPSIGPRRDRGLWAPCRGETEAFVGLNPEISGGNFPKNTVTFPEFFRGW